MKLYELINFDPVRSNRTRDAYSSKISTVGDVKKIGNGSFGTAYDIGSNKRLNQVTKVGRAGRLAGPDSLAKAVDEDGYLAYIKAIYDSKSDNSYFPRIHDLKIMKNKDGHLSYRINIEKLIPFNSEKIKDNEDLMISLYDDMFNKRTDAFESYGAAAGIRLTLDKESAYNRTDLIRDPELKEALELIYAVQRKGSFSPDMHSGNIMWRITGTRPQLVIVDPLA